MTAQPRQLKYSDVLQLIGRLEPSNIPSTAATLYHSMDSLIANYAQKPAKERAYLAKRFAKAACKGSVHQRLLALSVWQKITGTYRPLPALAKILRQQPLEINARIHALNGMVAVAFDGAAAFTPWQRAKLDRHCRRVYSSILGEARSAFAGASIDRLAATTPKTNNIALCTTQFLGRRHAPTAQILSMAKTLSRQGHTVKVFNQSLVPRRSASGFYFPFAAPKFDKLNTIDAFELGDGHRTGFWQNRHNEVTQEAFDGFVDALAQFAPAAMISLGPCNLYADLAANVVPSTSMPTTIDLAIGTPGAYGTVRPLTPLQETLFKPLGITPERVVHFPSSFSAPLTDGPVDRAEFGLKPDDYAVAIVSNRAGSEITEGFWYALTQVLAQSPQLQVRIFGSLNGLATWQRTEFQKHSQVRFLGHSADLFGALTGFDAMLNPPRLGGGTSAAYAMAHGLNLFTLGDCDVAIVGGDEFVYPALEDMLSALGRAASSPEQKDKVAARSKARWSVISDQNEFMTMLLDGARKVAA